jgi:hypothetical protein
MGTIKQTGIEILLQLPNLKSHRWLGHVQRFSRLSEAQQLGYSVKYLKSSIGHGLT